MPQKQKQKQDGKLRTRIWNPLLPPQGKALDLQVEGLQDPLTLEACEIYPQGFTGSTLNPEQTRSWIGSGFAVLASIDVTHHGRLLHVSISHGAALPHWSVLAALKRALYPPDVAAVMVLPEEDVYVNIHPYTFHLWQLPEKWALS